MFEEFERINSHPKPFEFYTASELWTDEHTSKQMLSYHLNEESDVSSRNAAFIDRSVEWIANEYHGRWKGLFLMRSSFRSDMEIFDDIEEN